VVFQLLQIEKLKRTPLHKRIGLSITNFNDDNIIKVQEKDFAKKFTNLGYSIKWINRIQPSDNGGYIPTNDFQWNSKEWELKKPKVKRYNSIFNMIKKATNKGKKRFILDFRQSSINRKLAENLSTYNIRNPHKQILELLVFEKHTLMRILLKKK
jgi:hypothetical protein